jgi:hypothetical protein
MVASRCAAERRHVRWDIAAEIDELHRMSTGALATRDAELHG